MMAAPVSLRRFNTLAVDVSSESYHAIHSVDDLVKWRDGQSGQPFFVLGGGSNVVFTAPPRIPILHMRGSTFSIEVERDAMLVTAGAGHGWHEFVERCLSSGAYGIENLALIPGTVGASPIQNIGAYGVEVKDVFHSLTAWDVDSGKLLKMSAAECGFGYRHSVFKSPQGQRLVVIDVTFRLSSRPNLQLDYGEVKATLRDMSVLDPSPADVFDAVCRIRRNKLPDPSVLPNVGSFFKNPVLSAESFARLKASHPSVPHYPASDAQFKVAAGWLIDQCGWKGRRVGNASVHERQALVLINHGADSRDILELARLVTSDVLARFSVLLEMEPVVV